MRGSWPDVAVWSRAYATPEQAQKVTDILSTAIRGDTAPTQGQCDAARAGAGGAAAAGVAPVSDRPFLPASCHVCAYYGSDVTCRRHPPSRTTEWFEVTRLPPQPPGNRCGKGAAVGAADAPVTVLCQACIHWWQPEGRPVVPDFKAGLPDAWWARAEFCTYAAPCPSDDEARRQFSRVTNGLDGCGEGTAVEGQGVAQPPLRM